MLIQGSSFKIPLANNSVSYAGPIQVFTVLPKLLTGFNMGRAVVPPFELSNLTPSVFHFDYRRFPVGIVLQISQLKHGFRYGSFYFQVGQDGAENINRSLVTCVKAKKRASICRTWFFLVVAAAKYFDQKFDGWLIYHSDLYPLLVSWVNSAISEGSIPFNTYIRFTVKEAGNIRFISFFHYLYS